jgi:hypothetical protein
MVTILRGKLRKIEALFAFEPVRQAAVAFRDGAAFFSFCGAAVGFLINTRRGLYFAGWRRASIGFLTLRRAFALPGSRQNRGRSFYKPCYQSPAALAF